MNPQENDVKKMIDDALDEYRKDTDSFTARKLTDTPTDALSVVNRKYVTLNGTSANRPRSSVIGQFYFDTTIHKPIYWDGTGFRDAAGNFV